MSEEHTARWNLPLLHPGQAQKETDHNEALTLLDIVSQPVAVSAGANVPPDDPQPGQCWIVGASPVGAWSGRAGALAGWTDGGWRFVAPRAGTSAWIADAMLCARFDGSAWVIGDAHAARLIVAGDQVVGARAAAIADPAGGATIDGEARAAIRTVLAALRHHGLVAT